MLKDKTIKDMLKHAEEEYPNEMCGVVVKTSRSEKYVRCVNISTTKEDGFVMCPDSFIEAEKLGEVIGIVHSHPDETTRPSAHDIAVMSRNRELELIIDPDSKPINWHIVSWPEGDYREVVPTVSESLLGKPFVHGVWDCWATCEAYYQKYHNILFKEYPRKDKWWEDKETVSFYEDFHKEAGFYEVSEPLPGDMIVMQIGRSYHPNHAGIYLGDVTEFEGRALFGKTLMLHHMYDKESDVIVYGGQWQQRTRMILRHKEVKHV